MKTILWVALTSILSSSSGWAQEDAPLKLAAGESGIIGAYSTDGQFIASSGRALMLWEAKTGRAIWTLDQGDPNHRSRVVAFNRESKIILTVEQSNALPGGLVAWEVETGKLR